MDKNSDAYKKAKEMANDTYGEKSSIYRSTYIVKMYNGYRDEQKLYQKKSHYSVLWNNKNIYK